MRGISAQCHDQVLSAERRREKFIVLSLPAPIPFGPPMTDLTRRSVLLGAATLAAAGPAFAQGPQQDVVNYQTINGSALQLRLFAGRRTALLIDPKRPVDRVAVARILEAFDRAWGWYADFYRAMPATKKDYAGRVPVAEVADQGFAWGATGVEILPSSTTLLLNGAMRDRYNQATFYCMGLNFWAFGKQLGKIDAFSWGFGEVNRFYAMAAAGITGAPWDVDLDFDHYRHSILI